MVHMVIRLPKAISPRVTRAYYGFRRGKFANKKSHGQKNTEQNCPIPLILVVIFNIRYYFLGFLTFAIAKILLFFCRIQKKYRILQTLILLKDCAHMRKAAKKMKFRITNWINKFYIN